MRAPQVRLVSQAHNVVFGRLYGFLLYNNFLILFLSSSLNTYYAILENPHDTLVQLGNFLPQISSFYVAYILIKALAGKEEASSHAHPSMSADSPGLWSRKCLYCRGHGILPPQACIVS